MNYCSISYSFYEDDYRVRRYAEALVAPGNKVDVIALNKNDQNTRGFFKLINGVSFYAIQTRKYNEKTPLSYLLKILFFFLKGSIFLLFRHLRYRYRIIHIHNVPDFLVFMAILPKIMGAKIILDIHDILPEFYCEKFNKKLDTNLSKVLFLTERMSVRFADHVIISNDLWREKIINRNEIPVENCTTILNYPAIEFFENTSDRPTPAKRNKKQFKIIYPGTISYHHGLDIAIKALSIVKKEIANVRLDIYPRSINIKYYGFLRNLIRSLHLEENVRFLDPVPIEELWTICQSANIGIVPKRGGIFADEAFSTKILDFMAARIPVIASKTKVDQYYFDDTMIMFFEPENPKDLARCIIELYENPKKGKILVKNAKKFVLNNSWELKKEIYYKIVDEIIK